jgi:hypothetical protein
MAYAATTNVTVSKTKGEIDGLLRKHRASGFGVFEEATRAILVFEMAERRIVFHLPLPNRDEKRFRVDGRGRPRSADKIMEAWEQGCRSRWRALFLCIKAKLESIESGIETFEDAFLAHIQMPDGHTVSEHVRSRIASAYESGTMTPLLPAPKGGGND